MGNYFLLGGRGVGFGEKAEWLPWGVLACLKFYPLGKRIRGARPVTTLSNVVVFAASFL